MVCMDKSDLYKVAKSIYHTQAANATQAANSSDPNVVFMTAEDLEWVKFVWEDAGVQAYDPDSNGGMLVKKGAPKYSRAAIISAGELRGWQVTEACGMPLAIWVEAAQYRFWDLEKAKLAERGIRGNPTRGKNPGGHSKSLVEFWGYMAGSRRASKNENDRGRRGAKRAAPTDEADDAAQSAAAASSPRPRAQKRAKTTRVAGAATAATAATPLATPPPAASLSPAALVAAAPEVSSDPWDVDAFFDTIRLELYGGSSLSAPPAASPPPPSPIVASPEASPASVNFDEWLQPEGLRGHDSDDSSPAFAAPTQPTFTLAAPEPFMPGWTDPEDVWVPALSDNNSFVGAGEFDHLYGDDFCFGSLAFTT